MAEREKITEEQDAQMQRRRELQVCKTEASAFRPVVVEERLCF